MLTAGGLDRTRLEDSDSREDGRIRGLWWLCERDEVRVRHIVRACVAISKSLRADNAVIVELKGVFGRGGRLCITGRIMEPGPKNVYISRRPGLGVSLKSAPMKRTPRRSLIAVQPRLQLLPRIPIPGQPVATMEGVTTTVIAEYLIRRIPIPRYVTVILIPPIDF